MPDVRVRLVGEDGNAVAVNQWLRNSPGVLGGASVRLVASAGPLERREKKQG